ncbi:glutathione S-transferase Mu 1-like [Argiope bruennichi]|uniref:glutathione transferase n=1 Tax=Argiope bruennichi TaxID=94029 RepID=A0A8T0E603_ARGBR|nr:glutathione S-transferase Mu 1-like [Argiope bruennichi]KAF8766817.1 Glutathione S-transferase Mu 1 like protein [Argiope bruennichi]
MSQPTLGYWDIRGIAEPIRFLLHYKGVDFVDKRYTFDDRAAWEKDKTSLKLDFPNLPYYLDGNIRLTQSNTILRYLAKKHELDGKTEEEYLRVSLAEQQISDLRASLIQLSYNDNFEKLKPDFVNQVPSHLKLVANFLGNRKFLAGDSVTYVDFMAYHVIDYLRYLIPNLLTDFPNLRDHQDRIRNLPELRKYLKSPAYKPWPLFSPAAQFGGEGPEPKR